VAVVESWHDGDSCFVRLADKRVEIRLIGMDSCELGQRPWGPDARDWFRVVCPPGSTVILIADSHHPADSYGRPIRWVEFGDLTLNIEAVRAGQAFAWKPVGRRVDRWAEVQAAEAEAVRAGVGVWAVPGGVMRPWVWRQQRR
jgi:endonuclease YncB( thermonuclease family)